MPILGEVIYTPIITLIIILISLYAISIVLSKRSQGGLIPNIPSELQNGVVDFSLIEFISTSLFDNNLDIDLTMCNRILYISGDKGNLSQAISVNMFDASEVQPGTFFTVFNSPTSLYPTQINVQMYSTGVVILGTGQGVTLISQRKIGSHLIVQLGSISFNPPDLTPSLLQPIEWVVFKYWNPQSNMCSPINSVAAGNLPVTDLNMSSPCFETGPNANIGLNGVVAGVNCTSLICQCLPNPLNIWPPPYSPWCNQETLNSYNVLAASGHLFPELDPTYRSNGYEILMWDLVGVPFPQYLININQIQSIELNFVANQKTSNPNLSSDARLIFNNVNIEKVVFQANLTNLNSNPLDPVQIIGCNPSPGGDLIIYNQSTIANLLNSDTNGLLNPGGLLMMIYWKCNYSYIEIANCNFTKFKINYFVVS